MGQRRRAGAVGSVVGLVLVLCSCGGSDGDDGAGGTSTTESPTTTLALPRDQQGEVDQTPPLSANGVVVAGDRLFVASLDGNEILAVDPTDGRITARFGPDAGVDGQPDDVAVAPDGTLYFTALAAGWVGRLGEDGQAERIATLGTGVNPITFSRGGSLFVGRLLAADELWELDSEGRQKPRLVAEGLGNVNAFQIGPDVALYGPRFGLSGKGAVVRVDVESGEVAVVAEGLDFPQQCDSPRTAICWSLR